MKSIDNARTFSSMRSTRTAGLLPAGSAAIVLVLGAFAASPAIAQNATSEAASAGELAASILGAKLRFSDGKVIIASVKRGGAADHAGVRPGDQLQSIEKHKIASPEDVEKVLKHFKPGDGLVMTVVPRAAPRQLYVAPSAPRTSPSQTGGAMLGVTLNDSSGAVVAGQLSMGGPAIVAGVRSGDQIVAIDGTRITSKSQLLGIVNTSHPGHRIQLTIQRGGWRRTLTVRLGARNQVAALPKMTVPSQTANQQQQQPAPVVNVEDPNDEWANEQEAEDIYNVNDRALYTDFD